MAESDVAVILEKIENQTEKIDELKSEIRSNNVRMTNMENSIIKHETKISILWAVAAFSAVQFGYIIFSIFKGVLK